VEKNLPQKCGLLLHYKKTAPAKINNYPMSQNSPKLATAVLLGIYQILNISFHRQTVDAI
jgi:hypothetical protein